jgi:hypothetical protein
MLIGISGLQAFTQLNRTVNAGYFKFSVLHVVAGNGIAVAESGAYGK